MNKTAYDACYLDDMIQKTRYLFKLIVRNCPDVFDVITAYMKSTYRKYIDMGNPLYLNKTPKQILGELGIRADVKKDISEEYDEFIFEWMADIYTYMQWKYNIFSSEIVEKSGRKNCTQNIILCMRHPLKTGWINCGRFIGFQSRGQLNCKFIGTTKAGKIKLEFK